MDVLILRAGASAVIAGPLNCPKISGVPKAKIGPSPVAHTVAHLIIGGLLVTDVDDQADAPDQADQP
jgi:hypothetical protein